LILNVFVNFLYICAGNTHKNVYDMESKSFQVQEPAVAYL